MSDLNLRAACIHGRYEPHTLARDYNHNATEECPGGREVIIDYEAAYQWASENFVPQKFIDQCLDAALGVEV